MERKKRKGRVDGRNVLVGVMVVESRKGSEAKGRSPANVGYGCPIQSSPKVWASQRRNSEDVKAGAHSVFDRSSGRYIS